MPAAFGPPAPAAFGQPQDSSFGLSSGVVGFGLPYQQQFQSGGLLGGNAQPAQLQQQPSISGGLFGSPIQNSNALAPFDRSNGPPQTIQIIQEQGLKRAREWATLGLSENEALQAVELEVQGTP